MLSATLNKTLPSFLINSRCLLLCVCVCVCVCAAISLKKAFIHTRSIGYFICTIPQRGLHIPRPLLHHHSFGLIFLYPFVNFSSHRAAGDSDKVDKVTDIVQCNRPQVTWRGYRTETGALASTPVVFPSIESNSYANIGVQYHQVYLKEGRKEIVFFLTTFSTHLIYGCMMSDVWERSVQVAREETRWCHMGYFFWFSSNGSFICTILQTG